MSAPLQSSTPSAETRSATGPATVYQAKQYNKHKRRSDILLNGADKTAKLGSIPANTPARLPVLRAASPNSLPNTELESDLKNRAVECYQTKQWSAYVEICRTLYEQNPHDIEPLKGIIKGNAELKVDDQVIHYVSLLLPLIPTEDVNSRVSALKSAVKLYGDRINRSAGCKTWLLFCRSGPTIAKPGAGDITSPIQMGKNMKNPIPANSVQIFQILLQNDQGYRNDGPFH